jgi:hypothetical protein
MRAPDLTIGPRGNPQMLRWHLLQFGGIQIALHKWLRSDQDRAPHDHRADNISILLNRSYVEQTHKPLDADLTSACEAVYQAGYPTPSYMRGPNGEWYRSRPIFKRRLPFIPYFRRAESPHRVEIGDKPVWSIWIRFAPRRTWGFWCPKGWLPYSALIGDYSKPGAESVMNRSC